LLLEIEKTGLYLVEGKTLKEISKEYNILYNTLKSRANFIKKNSIPLTLNNLLYASKIYSACQSITNL